MSDDVKPYTDLSPPQSRVTPKGGALMANKKALITSKSSMMGVLGVVPEENDSNDEENLAKYTTFSHLGQGSAKKMILS
jgi:hypothetical protein